MENKQNVCRRVDGFVKTTAFEWKVSSSDNGKDGCLI
jgi:hypothetical protein